MRHAEFDKFADEYLASHAANVRKVVVRARKVQEEIADRAYVLQPGRIVLSGPAAPIAGNAAVRKAYLGI